MTSSRIALLGPVLCLNLVMLQSLAVTCRAGSFDQDEDASSKPKVLIPGGVGSSLLSINEDYARQLLQLERQRLVRLGQLAARQSPNEAAETYEQLFRSAIANNLFREAEPAAQQVLKSASAPINQFLARTIDIIASADRGAYDESLSELRTVIESVSKPTQPATAARSTRPHCWRCAKPITSVYCRQTSLTPSGKPFNYCKRNRLVRRLKDSALNASLSST